NPAGHRPAGSRGPVWDRRDRLEDTEKASDAHSEGEQADSQSETHCPGWVACPSSAKTHIKHVADNSLRDRSLCLRLDHHRSKHSQDQENQCDLRKTGEPIKVLICGGELQGTPESDKLARA